MSPDRPGADRSGADPPGSAVPGLGAPPVGAEVRASREAQVGALRVRRALPQRGRRSVGAWCFVDHVGPAQVSEEHGLDVGPHPHIGLQTVTWLVAGEARCIATRSSASRSSDRASST